MEDSKKSNDHSNPGNPGYMLSLMNEILGLKERVSALEAKVDMLVMQNKQLAMILKYVVTPLIIILGALIGVKLTLP